VCKHQLNRKNVKLGLMQQILRVLSVQHARQAIFVLKNQLYQLFALVVLTVKHLRHLAYPVLPVHIALKAPFNQSSVVVVSMQGHRQPCVRHAPQAILPIELSATTSMSRWHILNLAIRLLHTVYCR